MILEIAIWTPAVSNWVKNNFLVHTHDAITISCILQYCLFVIHHLFSIVHWSFHSFSLRTRKRETASFSLLLRSTFVLFLYIHIDMHYSKYIYIYIYPIVVLMMNYINAANIISKVYQFNSPCPNTITGRKINRYTWTVQLCIVYEDIHRFIL